MNTNKEHLKSEKQDKVVGLYVSIKADNSFNDAARSLITLVAEAENLFPRKTRFLYLDIEGHRDEDGRFDQDMFELQTIFLFKMIMPYIKKVFMPLGQIENPAAQRNDVFTELSIRDLKKK